VLITPSAWGSQLAGYNHHQLHASHQVPAKVPMPSLALRATGKVNSHIGISCGQVDDVNTRPVGNPKWKVWWAQQQVFPSVRNQGMSNQGGRSQTLKVMLASFMTLQQGRHLRYLLARLQLVATRNVFTTQPNTLLPTYDEVVNSPVCCKQRNECIEWKK
jgi:hypothetical protein